MKQLTEFLYIGVGGFFGAVSRFYISGFAHRLFGKGFPYGTLVVNVGGSFLLGLITYLALNRDIMNQNLRFAMTVGFLGAFTTFSTFSYETFNLLKEGSYYLSAVNMVTNLVICLLAVSLGVALAGIIDKVISG
jgi:CrcB protein